MSRRSRFLRIALVFAVFTVLGVLVMPGRLWFGQRNDIAQAQDQLDALKVEHRKLSAQVDRLGSKSLIEHEARAGFGWVHIRDELYTVPPAPPLEVQLPDVWPFNELQEPLAEAAKDS
jgi:hypothetical protein